VNEEESRVTKKKLTMSYLILINIITFMLISKISPHHFYVFYFLLVLGYKEGEAKKKREKNRIKIFYFDLLKNH